MSERTRIEFFGCLLAPYAGAARGGCMPTDPKATGWHVVVGGNQASIDSIEDFAKYFDAFLRYAYEAGVKDTKADLREKMGLR